MEEKRQSKLEQLAERYQISAFSSAVIAALSYVGQIAMVDNLTKETQHLTEYTTRYPSLTPPDNISSSIANTQQLISLLNVIVTLAGIVFTVSILCYLFCGILKASKADDLLEIAKRENA